MILQNSENYLEDCQIKNGYTYLFHWRIGAVWYIVYSVNYFITDDAIT